MKQKFRTQYNRDEMPQKYEVNTLPSKTIPDETMSLKTILARYARGLPINGYGEPVYNGDDDDLPDFSRMDKVELEEYRQNHRELVKLQEEDLKQKQKEQREAKEKQNPKKTAPPEGAGGETKHEKGQKNAGSGADGSEGQGAAAK